MKFTLERSDLLPRLETVGMAVAPKTVKPVLAGILLRISDEGEIILMATDLESSVKTRINATVFEGEAASFVVEASLFMEIVRNLSEGKIRFTLEATNFNIDQGKSHFLVPTMSAEDYPDFDSMSAGTSLTESLTALELMIDRTLFCAARDEFMRNLNGIYWEFEGDYFRLVAADGFRMALSESRIENGLDERFLLSLRSMKNLHNAMKSAKSDQIAIVFDGSRVGFSFDDTEIVARIVEADFPDYRKVLPKAFKTRVKVETRAFLDVLRRSSIAAKFGSDSIKIELVDGQIILMSSSQDHGESVDELTVEKDGEDLTIAFNPRFLSEAMKKVDTEQTELSFVDAGSALQINPIGVEGYIYIVMPIRLI